MAFTPGSPHTVTVTLRNNGAGPALSVMATITILPDVGEVALPVSSIPAGAQVAVQAPFTISPGALPGSNNDWFVRAVYDGRNEILGSGNAFTVQIAAPAGKVALQLVNIPIGSWVNARLAYIIVGSFDSGVLVPAESGPPPPPGYAYWGIFEGAEYLFDYNTITQGLQQWGQATGRWGASIYDTNGFATAFYSQFHLPQERGVYIWDMATGIVTERLT